MPWNNQGGGGGGPWGPSSGGGGPNPWGRPSGGGQQPPDLEELLRKGQDRFRRMAPRGFGGGKVLALIVAVLVLLVVGSSMVYRVQPDEEGIILRFGEYVRSEVPGLHVKLPAPIETVERPPVTRRNRIDIGFQVVGNGGRTGERDVSDESLMLTGDENIVDIDFTVFWQIQDAEDYLFNIREPEATVKKAAESAMREVIGQTELQPALAEARSEIEMRTLEILQRMLDEYQAGIAVKEVKLQKSDPPGPVIDAFNEVQRARQDRERLRNEAEAYRNKVIPEARGEAERIRQEAAAYREQTINLAQGDAQRFLQVYEAYNASRDVTARRMYLETMEAILRGTNKVIIDGNAEGAGGVVPYLPLTELQRATGANAPAAGR